MNLAIIIPAYNVAPFILDLLDKIDDSIARVFVVDDCCPQNSGKLVLEKNSDPRVKVVFHEKNKGVGGAVISGYKAFLEEENLDIAIKIDGDGQMDPALIPGLINPILSDKADYAKGNRFFNLKTLRNMPTIRLIGNSALSLINKAVNGYWHIMDPTNGFTAIHKNGLMHLDLDKIDERYFFESDMLFRLGVNRAKVADFPMDAFYGDEESGLKVSRVLFEFPLKYLTRFFKRIFYNYFLRDFNAGSVQLFLGLILVLFGSIFGALKWWNSITSADGAPIGTVMLAALPVIIGSQLLMGFLHYDVSNSPK